MNREKKIEITGWLIILVGAFLCLAILSLPSVSAIELNLTKNESCNLFNYTGTQCDSFWCTSGLNGNWTIDGICLINITQPTENTTNMTNISYFNETLVREIALNITNEILANSSFINASTMIAIKNAILEAQENRTEELVKSYINDNEPQALPTPPWVWFVLIFGMCSLWVAVYWIKSKSTKKEDSEYDFHRKPVEKDIYRPKQGYISPNMKKERRNELKEKYKPLVPEEDIADAFEEEEIK